MRPVLIGAAERPDGRWTLTYSVRPGRRVTLTAGPEVLTEPLAEQMLSVIVPMLDKAGNTDRPPI
jgi:hypothetical protein